MPRQIDLEGMRRLIDQGAQVVEMLTPGEYGEDHIPATCSQSSGSTRESSWLAWLATTNRADHSPEFADQGQWFVIEVAHPRTQGSATRGGTVDVFHEDAAAR